ncbi:MAG: hypothetical protein A3F70_15635 [Acidobacteria bacterium RIFCSPLOWO2_12_FULL_67_14]|nr:MAG: hypothetical protein A3H29_03315 [Acidobacteria bacterium RIFCSPLOWO2_02_FULL_67_21]OFW35317.1 MAG: hypothetical protein A3F70_15635 [Acidobacteria bacterium RIFCSPLOWO2_12_FULL_67_14]
MASALLVTGVAALVQLFAIATRATSDARDTTIAAVLAEQKMEELRSAAFAAAPPGESEEHLTGFVRRSRIEPLPLDPQDAVVITVEVFRPGRQLPASRLITVKARNVP